MVEFADFYVLAATLAPILMVGTIYLSAQDEGPYVELDAASPWWHRALDKAMGAVDVVFAVGLAGLVIFYSLFVLAGIWPATATGRGLVISTLGGQFAIGVRGLFEQVRDQRRGRADDEQSAAQ